MEQFLLSILSGIASCACYEAAKFTYKKVKNHSNANKSGFKH